MKGRMKLEELKEKSTYRRFVAVIMEVGRGDIHRSEVHYDPV